MISAKEAAQQARAYREAAVNGEQVQSLLDYAEKHINAASRSGMMSVMINFARVQFADDPLYWSILCDKLVDAGYGITQEKSYGEPVLFIQWWNMESCGYSKNILNKKEPLAEEE